MNSYAIVLGVPQYDNVQDLPACGNDASIMKDLFKATNKFNILSIPSDSSKEAVLNHLEEFLPLASEEGIDEVVFYFSGHGCHDESDTHFALKGTLLEQISGTSLNNLELDTIVRKRNPRLFIKIIDACESGLTYIKSITKDDLFGNLFPTDKALENCYFMCSSKQSQPSIADNEYSFFTRELVLSVADLVDKNTIRYTDIQNSISDSFRAKGIAQTPFFTTQSSGLETFAETTSELKSFSHKIKAQFAPLNDAKIGESMIEQSIDCYLTRHRNVEEIAIIMKQAIEEMMNLQIPKTFLENYYTIAGEENGGFSDYRKDSTVLNFLKSRYKEEHLYLELDTDKRKSENLFGIPTWNEVPTEYYITQHNLPKCFCYKLNPKNEGLPIYHILHIFIYGRTYFYTLQIVKQYIHNGDSYEVYDKTKMVYKQFDYSDFNVDSWSSFQMSQLEKNIKFIEDSLLRFVK
jgi:hypothetical protein